MKIAVLCPSEIAYRRFMPALSKCKDLFTYVGVAFAGEDEWFGSQQYEVQLKSETEKAKKFQSEYGGQIFENYNDLLSCDAECVYIPLPPALHYFWAKKALEHGKHVLLEKPFTTSLEDTRFLLEYAKTKSLTVHENYMFKYHSQIEYIRKELENKTIGDIRLIRVDFGFPFRGLQDFRYNKEMGGGALMDCGGYVLKLVSVLLGKGANVKYAKLFQADNMNLDVDLYGNAVIETDCGITVQLSFGMDNDYRCNLDIWGSKGSIFTDRILTAPEGFSPTLRIKHGTDIEERKLPLDDTFEKSIRFFHDCIIGEEKREYNYKNILEQAMLVERCVEYANNRNGFTGG